MHMGQCSAFLGFRMFQKPLTDAKIAEDEPKRGSGCVFDYVEAPVLYGNEGGYCSKLLVHVS